MKIAGLFFLGVSAFCYFKMTMLGAPEWFRYGVVAVVAFVFAVSCSITYRVKIK